MSWGEAKMTATIFTSGSTATITLGKWDSKDKLLLEVLNIIQEPILPSDGDYDLKTALGALDALGGNLSKYIPSEDREIGVIY